jgi:hypothetical protein
VRRKFGFVFAAQATSDFSGKAAQHLVGGINHEPLALDFMRFGGKCLHLERRPCKPDYRKPVILV